MSQKGLEIIIVHSNLGRRYKKIGDQLYLMLEKESTKLEDSLTAMVRINKENEEIDRKKEIEKIKKQAQIKVQFAKEEKDTKIQELEKLKKLYEEKLKAKEKQKRQQEESQLTEEIEKFKTLLEETNILEDRPKIGIDEINEQNSEADLDQYSETSETYSNLIEKKII